MAARALSPEIRANLTIEQRIELVMDLTRRLELLDDLMRAAREKRGVTSLPFSRIDLREAELDSMESA